MIRTDKQRVMQVLLGLQSNALKFTKDGQVLIFVNIIQNDGQDFLQIQVEDNGIGISKEN
jgi:signal transduction histidine kinase